MNESFMGNGVNSFYTIQEHDIYKVPVNVSMNQQ